MQNNMRRCFLFSLALSLAMIQLPYASANGKFIELKAVFDTSVLPEKHSPFQIGIKHTNIIYPQSYRAALRGKSDFFSLRAGTTTLQGSAGATTLKGTVTAAPKESTLHTVEHGVSSQFYLDLRAMIPKFAPDISRSLDAQIADTNRKLAAQVSAAAPKLQAQLQAPKTVPTIPGKPRSDIPDLPKLLQVAGQNQPLMPAKPIGTIANPIPGNLQTANAGRLFPANLRLAANPVLPGSMQPGSGFMPPGSLNGTPGGGSLTMPPAKPGTKLSQVEQAMRSQLANAKVNSNISSATIDAQRTNAKLALPARPDQSVNAQLRIPTSGTDVNGRLRLPTTDAQVLPSLDSLAAKARLLPSSKMPSAPGNDALDEMSGQKAILWDAWHKNFSNVAGAAVRGALNKVGSPKGTNTVTVTVWPNNHMQVSLSKPSNSKFDAAVLQAYRTLEGSKTLSYPAGSLRSSVSFSVDNKHLSEDLVSVVNSKTTSGDKEVLQHGHGTR